MTLRIGFVTGIFPPDPGGPASYVSAIASSLAERNAVVGVVTLSDDPHPTPAEYPFPVVRIERGGSRLRRQIRTIAEIRSLARGADVLLVAGLPFEAALARVRKTALVNRIAGDLAWERARLAGRTPLSIDEFQRRSRWGRDRLLHRIQAWVMRRADAVIAPSWYLKSIVTGWGVPAETVFVVPNACYVDPLALRDEMDKEVDLIVVGRLVPHKRIDEVIRLAARRSWSLEIVGNGPERDALERLASELRATGVRFRGALPRHSVLQAISRARILVMNSEYEGHPHAALEAMAAGVPVIARAIGGNHEAIRDGIDGRLVPDGGIASFETAIYELLADPERRVQMGQAGQDRVGRDFSLVRIVTETEKVLEWAVQQKRGGR